MTLAMTDGPARAKPLRLWPGVILVAFQWFAWIGVSVLYPPATPWGIFAMLGAGLAMILWWLFFSRAPWLERLGIFVLMVIAIVATKRVVHESIAGGGMGNLLYIYAIPAFSLALVAGAVVSRGLTPAVRRATMAGAILIACGSFMLLRTGGVTGEGDSDLHWRWSATPEQRLLRQPSAAPVALPVTAAATTAVEWPGFRGPGRDSIVRGTRIATDWSAAPPVELWRRPIGPGWSSFAVRGERIYTQEQRGEEELVSCYRLSTGEPVWSHRDAVRFWESNGGAGPRGTPTLHEGRVYTLGATGVVNALDADTGAVVWSRDAASDSQVQVPEWGFASSPLVTGDLVVVAAEGRLVGYDHATGDKRWLGPAGGAGYSSPHAATIDGVPQILLLRSGGVTSVAPADGTVLWVHEAWDESANIVQPALAENGDVLMSALYEMGGRGMRRLAVARGTAGWKVEERWESRALKPYFNDFVVHEGHAFGFDNSVLACIDLADGARKWKGGRYGHGQLVLLADEDMLLVLSEEGELVLVAATPERFTELARFEAIAGKTWNHPVLVGDVVLVRNAEEMAAFRLPTQR